MFKIGKSTETEERLVVVKGWGSGRNAEWLLIVAWFLGSSECSGIREWCLMHKFLNKSYWTVHFREVKFIVCELYLNKASTLFEYLFIWLCWVLVAAYGTFGLHCMMQDLLVMACEIYLVPQPGNNPRSPALGAWSLNHWTTREVPELVFFLKKNGGQKDGSGMWTSGWLVTVSGIRA